VISGGQGGADTVALEVAKELGIATGGWAPPGFLTSEGVNLALRDVYGLLPMEMPTKSTSAAASLVQRSCRNVDSAQATVAFRITASPGTDKTIWYCATGRWPRGATNGALPPASVAAHTPCCVVTRVGDAGAAMQSLLAFVLRHRPATLNVVGHRASVGGAVYVRQVRLILLLLFGRLRELGCLAPV